MELMGFSRFTPDDNPPEGVTVLITGDFFFPPGFSGGWIQVSQLDVMTEGQLTNMRAILKVERLQSGVISHYSYGKSSSVPTVNCVGQIVSVFEKRYWNVDVSIHDRAKKRELTFQIQVRLPDPDFSPRFRNLSEPILGSTVYIRGLLSYMSIRDDCITEIDLYAITFLNKIATPKRQSNAPSLQGSTAKSGFPGRGAIERKLFAAAASPHEG
ncbi:hypothetical protein RhiLY_11815 [Ceratobasidium sp. AG-Ba]|nr:hypothetical protein RhiLY_11815 [Ceratobasidium sp. AG-Ba]